MKSQVETFIGITSASRDEALFFLESHNFDLESAIHSYYENNAATDLDSQGLGRDLDELEEEEEVAAAPRSLGPSLVPPPSFAPVPAAMSSREDKKKKAASKPSGSRGGIRTLADLNRSAGSGSDSDSDGPQEYYTGGEKSGMLVQDPTKGGHDIDQLFDQARQRGAMQGPFEHQQSSSSRSFTGTGRLLSGETVPAAPRPPENVVHNIYFWRNGFTVDDGPLRRFDDPANAPFVESIRNSECPKELEPEDRRSTVHVNLIRRVEEDCPEPVTRPSPFQGVGRTLGSSSTEAAAQATPTAAPAAVAVEAPVVVDDSKPTTSIQLRLADGSRTVARFNTDHTVGDIRAFINNHMGRSGAAAPPSYTLQTVGFPPKQLTDVTQTIKDAGLANSVVIQKL